MGQPEEAVTHYRKATEIDSRRAVAFCNLGGALNQLKRFDEAFAALDRAIDLLPILPKPSSIEAAS
ncbi:tetratricopeptide repeat protein [Bradyrhizobium sp.]|jgi:Flp pilus assembly protein TadD|uniref:tetratricopeptide repeat protein n=1 Tax=Bradyrhizobium sp. TaxID=376 RepID=UPI003C7053C7